MTFYNVNLRHDWQEMAAVMAFIESINIEKTLNGKWKCIVLVQWTGFD